MAYMQTYHALLCSKYFVFPSHCRSYWVDPIPSRPNNGTPADESCHSNSGDAIDSPHLKVSFHSMGPALHRPHYPLPELSPVMKYQSTRVLKQQEPIKFS